MKLNIKNNENTKYELCPEYNGAAIFVGFTELKTYNTEYGDKEQFRLLFEIPVERTKGKNFVVASKPMIPSLHPKSSLYKTINQMRGHEFTAEESANGLDTDSLIGTPVQLIVSHVQSGENTFANIVFIGKYKGKEEDLFDVTYEPKEKEDKPVNKPVTPTVKKVTTGINLQQIKDTMKVGPSTKSNGVAAPTTNVKPAATKEETDEDLVKELESTFLNLMPSTNQS